MIYLLREEYMDLLMKMVSSPSKTITDSTAWKLTTLTMHDKKCQLWKMHPEQQLQLWYGQMPMPA
jgi:hypothetical protein